MKKFSPKEDERSTHTFNHRRHKKLTDRERFEKFELQDYIDSLPLKPGEKVLDLGTGPGALLELIDSKVGGTGNIAAADISLPMLKNIEPGETEAGLLPVCVEEKRLPF
ncbi:MAG: hypothetical protein ACQEP7_07710, partial [bacterium]